MFQVVGLKMSDATVELGFTGGMEVSSLQTRTIQEERESKQCINAFRNTTQQRLKSCAFSPLRRLQVLVTFFISRRATILIYVGIQLGTGMEVR